MKVIKPMKQERKLAKFIVNHSRQNNNYVTFTAFLYIIQTFIPIPTILSFWCCSQLNICHSGI